MKHAGTAGTQYTKGLLRAGLEHHPPVPHTEGADWHAGAEIALMPYQPALQHAASFSPIKSFEAMAAGRRVIASDLAALVVRGVWRDWRRGAVDPRGHCPRMVWISDEVEQPST